MASRFHIRLALVGLTANPGAFTWANNVHLPYFQSHPKAFTVAAVLGSTQQAAQAAIQKFSLPGSTKAYGAPEELAKNPDIDLVVVAIKVHAHLEAVEPSILAGKDVFVEWPLGMNLKEAQRLKELADVRKVRTVVGLQGRYARIVERVGQLVKGGAIGKVLSTTVVGTVPTGDGVSERESVKYSLAVDSGATILDIHFAHFIDSFTHILGPISSLSANISTQHPTTALINSSGAIVDPEYPKPAPDQILMHATLSSGAVASLHMRGGTSLAGGLHWLIYGQKGEIEIAGPTMLLHINMGLPWKIGVKYMGSGEVREDIWEEGTGQPAVRRLWDAFLKGEHGGWPDFGRAIEVHGVVEGMYRSFKEQKVVAV